MSNANRQAINLWLLIFSFLLLLNACSEAAKDAEVDPKPQEIRLVSIELSPNSPKLATNTKTQLTAIGIYEDNTKRDITNEVTWESTNSDIASFTHNNTFSTRSGTVRAISSGDVTVRAIKGGVRSKYVKLSVTDGSLEYITLESTSPTAAVGTSKKLVVLGHFSDGSVQNMTNDVEWVSGDPTIATIDSDSNPGLLQAIAIGITTIEAKIATFTSNSLAFTVNDRVLREIHIEPANAKIGIGTHKQFTAVGIFDNDTTQDLTQDVDWVSASQDVAIFAHPMAKGRLKATGAGISSISAVLGDINSNNVKLEVTAAALMDIRIDSKLIVDPDLIINDVINMPMGTQTQFYATGIYKDLTIQDLTDDVIWASENQSVATVFNAFGRSGLAIPIAIGSTKIAAVYRGVSSDLATLAVTDAQLESIVISPADAIITKGEVQKYLAFGYYTDSGAKNISNLVTWKSSDPNTVSIDNSQMNVGTATGLANGNSIITAELNGIASNNAFLTVSDGILVGISINPSNATLPLGFTQQFTAMGTYENKTTASDTAIVDTTTIDITSQVVWKSSDANVVLVSTVSGEEGLASGLTEGSAVISASYLGQSDQAAITISPSILTKIKLTPQNTSVQVGSQQLFDAVGTFSNGSKNINDLVVWATSDPAIASVVNGVVSTHMAGNVTITASDVNDVVASASAMLNILNSTPTINVSSSNDITQVKAGDTLQMIATGGAGGYHWTIDNSVGASIDPDTGLLTGLAAGKLINVTATDINNIAGSVAIEVIAQILPKLESISITPINKSIIAGQTLQYTAFGTYADQSSADLTTSVTWQSWDTNSVIFTRPGLAESFTLVNATVQISAQLNGFTGTTQLIVAPPSLTVTAPVSPINALGAKAQFEVTGGIGPYTWSVSNTNLATIDIQSGLLTPLQEGNVTVLVIDTNGVKGSLTAVITGPLLSGLFEDAQLQDCVNAYAANSGGLKTTDQITSLGLFCTSAVNDIPIASLNGLEYLTHLTSLDLSGKTISNISPLANLVSLVGLDLSANIISDISALSNLRNLELLSLKNNAIIATTSLSALSNLTKLRKLKLSNNTTTSLELDQISGLIALDELHLNSVGIDGLKFISGMSGLSILSAESNAITDISVFNSLPTLTELAINNNPIIDPSPIASLSNLVVLDISEVAVSQVNFTNVFGTPGTFPKLSKLAMIGIGVSDVLDLANLNSLGFLAANGNAIVNIKPITGLANLTKLYLSNNLISDLSTIGSLSNLSSLDLTKNPINNADFVELKNLISLTELGLQQTGISDLSVLSPLNLLQRLNLGFNAVIDVGPLSTLKSLKTLYIHNNTIGGFLDGNVNQLALLINASVINLSNNINMSCQHLNDLITALNTTASVVVTPSTIVPAGANQTCTDP